MPRATVRGVEINYEVLGERGPWVALQPGGRRGLVGVKSLGEKIAEAGHRVLVYDRRNCGASGVSSDSGNSENEVWAEDLHGLLLALDPAPAWLLLWRGDRRCVRRPAPGSELLHRVYRGG